MCGTGAALEGLSNTGPGLSAHDLWAPHHHAASPTLKYALLWALMVCFLFAPSASLAPPGEWALFQSPLVPTAPSFLPPHLFPKYSNKAGP